MTNTCIICLDEDLISIKYTFPCNCIIFFHKLCLQEWYKNNINHHLCPICRISIRQTDNITFDTVIQFNQYIINEPITYNPIYRLTHPQIRNSIIIPPYSYIWNYNQNTSIIQKILYYLYMISIIILIFGCATLPFIIFYMALKYNW